MEVVEVIREGSRPFLPGAVQLLSLQGSCCCGQVQSGALCQL